MDKVSELERAIAARKDRGGGREFKGNGETRATGVLLLREEVGQLARDSATPRRAPPHQVRNGRREACAQPHSREVD